MYTHMWLSYLERARASDCSDDDIERVYQYVPYCIEVKCARKRLPSTIMKRFSGSSCRQRNGYN